MQLHDFRRINLLISKIAAITLGDSFIHSRLDYCNSLFYGILNYSIHRQQRFKIQLLALSLVVSHSSHITPNLKYLHWLPVNYCINFKICCITHRALSVHEPHYLSSLFSRQSNSHSLCSSSYNPLLLPFFQKKSYGFHSFSYATPHLCHMLKSPS